MNMNNEIDKNSEIAEETKSVIQEKTEESPVLNVIKTRKKKKEPFLRGGRGQVHVKATYNNTVVAVTDLNGAVLIWSSAGKCGFKGPKKATPYAATVIVESMIEKVKNYGIKEVDVFVKGVGAGRESAVRAFSNHGVMINVIKDMTPVPHNGCRAPKPRRV